MRSVMPTIILKIPGTMNAARHEKTSVKAPAIMGAIPMPKLPKTPFIPSALPLFLIVLAIQAIPTG